MESISLKKSPIVKFITLIEQLHQFYGNTSPIKATFIFIVLAIKYFFKKNSGFLTQYKLALKLFTQAPLYKIEIWFNENNITIGLFANISQRLESAKRFLFM